MFVPMVTDPSLGAVRSACRPVPPPGPSFGRCSREHGHPGREARAPRLPHQASDRARGSRGPAGRHGSEHQGGRHQGRRRWVNDPGVLGSGVGQGELPEGPGSHLQARGGSLDARLCGRLQPLGGWQAVRRAAGIGSVSVKFTGVVGKGKAGIYPVEVAGMPTRLQIRMQTGPAINGTDLRDATGDDRVRPVHEPDRVPERRRGHQQRDEEAGARRRSTPRAHRQDRLRSSAPSQLINPEELARHAGGADGPMSDAPSPAPTRRGRARRPQRRQVLRQRSMRSRASISTSIAARSRRCSARTAPASRR